MVNLIKVQALIFSGNLIFFMQSAKSREILHTDIYIAGNFVKGLGVKFRKLISGSSWAPPVKFICMSKNTPNIHTTDEEICIYVKYMLP